MKVFKVNEDNKYQCLITDEQSQLHPLVDRLNQPIGEFVFPEFYVSTPKDLVGNFYQMAYELLVFDNIAGSALASEVAVAGEHYAVEVEEVGTLNVLNVTETCDALDYDKSVWRDEEGREKFLLLDYVFLPARTVTKSGLFRIAEDRYSRILAVTGAPNQQGDFYTRYHEAGLTGLKFTELWSDEGL